MLKALAHADDGTTIFIVGITKNNLHNLLVGHPLNVTFDDPKTGEQLVPKSLLLFYGNDLEDVSKQIEQFLTPNMQQAMRESLTRAKEHPRGEPTIVSNEEPKEPH